MAVVILTTGVPGCGKTYVRAARFLVDDFLINTRGIHFSNFPLEVDTIAQDVSKKLSKGFFKKLKRVTPEDIKRRIQIIPDDVLQSWRREESGPWDYFKGVNLKYAHIAIDEIHNFISSSKSDEYLKLWDEFLGEVRHRGCTFEGVTQDIGQVGQVLKGRAAVRLELIPAEDLRDPWFKIKMSDWYELKASLSGFYHKTVFEFEKRKMFSSWKTNHCRRFLITPDYFKYYRSYEASLQEKEAGSTTVEDRTPLYEFQKRSRLSLICWFLRRNWFTLSWRSLLAVFVFWLCFCGGLNFFIQMWLKATQRMHKSNTSVERVEKKNSAVPPATSVSNSGSSASFTSSVSASPSVSSPALIPISEDEKNKPAMFFDGCCWLRSGVKISPGYIFKVKTKDGMIDEKNSRIVVRIDAVERCYYLNNGDIVYMF